MATMGRMPIEQTSRSRTCASSTTRWARSRCPRAALWRAQTQRAVENFPISGVRVEPAHVRALAADQGRGRAGQRASSGVLAAGRGRTPSAAAAAGGRGRRARRPVPRRRLPDRVGHVDEHERQRGGRRAGLAAARPAACTPTTRSTPRSRATTPSRPPIHVAATAGAAAGPAAGPGPPRGGAARRKAGEFADVVKAGPHPPDGRHAGDARPGARRLRRPGPAAASSGSQATLPRVAELPLGGTAVGTGINTPPGFAAAVIAELARAHRAAAHRGPQPLRGAGRPRRARRALRAAAHGRGRPHQDLQRPALDGLRARCAGLGEIHLPDLQPGSSIMPGKVNPVVPRRSSRSARR